MEYFASIPLAFTTNDIGMLSHVTALLWYYLLLNYPELIDVNVYLKLRQSDISFQISNTNFTELWMTKTLLYWGIVKVSLVKFILEY